ncbi:MULTISPECIES: hypothetical protein [Paraburkholderia]|nr:MULTISPECIES: hypothetical protein [Paraburkholderia]MCX4177677.1 hypothetical protein [Paraburkholderia madseniana]
MLIPVLLETSVACVPGASVVDPANAHFQGYICPPVQRTERRLNQ